jgi:acetyltransferase-like isoleucine patch superfamily enzyme
MKIFVKKFITLINTVHLLLIKNNISIRKSFFYLVKVKIDNNNNAYFEATNIEATVIRVIGKNNLVKANNALISNSNINIKGTNNKLIIENGVKLRSAIIHIRGNNCSIQIGKNTSIGGVRLVNVGNDNTISIGQNCLFSDFIEIWASDTHTIMNNKDEIINHERPIYIGNNVWIGSHVIILKGVTIQDGSIIGMGTIVTEDIPPNAISVGSPNHTVRENIKWKLDY